MKTIFGIFVGLIVLSFVIGLIKVLILLAIHLVFKLALLAIFCGIVYWLFKLVVGREKAF